MKKLPLIRTLCFDVDINSAITFAVWAVGFGLSGATSSPGADPDNDGLPNAAEYVLGGSPVSSASPHAPAVGVSGGNMILTFSREDAAESPGVSVIVESGTDLVTWPAAFNIGPDTGSSSPGVTIAENGSGADTISVRIPLGNDIRKFARLKAAVAP